ncbi:hypothetical protein FGO68_gene16107 [Halteria grandinella]|uniref:Uncharacterized protein n=1 Tax=Halteria grandinella TaxID=5974 RepID=A0A8J8NDF4_HALGN|nr:hypothetical protein FGO68_gene16107 [Halteria grandinella]
MGLFTFKFILDCQIIRDKSIEQYCQKEEMSRQWITIIDKLPVGMLVIDGEDIKHANTHFGEMTSSKSIQV